MSNRIKQVTTIGLALTFTLGVAACSSSSSTSPSASASPATWRVGLEAPLTGNQSTLGKGMLQGAQLAADEVNAAGGVSGRNIEIVQIDDAADPETGVTAATAAIAAGLDGVVGPYNSGVGAKTLPLYLQAGLVPIRLTSDNSTDGQGFTLQPMSNQIAPVATKALTDFYKAKSVGIIYDSTQNYTKSVSKAIKQELETAGVKVTSYQAITPGEDNYTDTVKAVESKKPDVIYPAVYFPEGAKIAGEITPGTQGKASTRCLLDYASYDTGLITDAGTKTAQNCNVVGVPAPSDFPNSADHVAAFQTQFDQAPGTWSPYTYDSVKFLLDGVGKAGGWDAKGLTDYLSGVSGWEGWTGSVTIEPKTGNRNPATVVVTDVTSAGEFHVASAWAKATDSPY